MPGLESLGIRDGLLYPYRYNSGFDDADGSTLRVSNISSVARATLT